MIAARHNSGIYHICLFFITLFVFEEAIYGRLALSSQFYVAAKTFSEVVLYALLMLIIMIRMAGKHIQPYSPTLFDIFIITFVIFALISSLLNQGGLFESALNLRTMLRYIAIYYIIVLFNWVPAKRQLMQIIKIIIAIALFQSSIGLLQSVMGQEFIDAYFSATKTEFKIGEISRVINAMTHKLGAGFGTFGKTTPYALFLLIADILILAVVASDKRKAEWKWWACYIFITVGIFYSYKRGMFLFALTAPFIVAWILGNKKIVKLYTVGGAIVTFIFVIFVLSKGDSELVREKEVKISPVKSLTQLFSGEYWERSSSTSRGWMIIEVGSEVLSSFRIIGYGADEENTKRILAKKGGEFAKLVGWGAFDDVYIISALAYYGPVGLLILLMAFSDIYRKANYLIHGLDGEYRVLGVIVMVVLIMTLFASFLVRVLEFRAFAFMLWFFAGTAVSIVNNRHLIRSRSEAHESNFNPTMEMN